MSVYVSNVILNSLNLSEVEILEMSDEYLIDITFMKYICKKAIFDFYDNKVLFEI